MIYTNKLTKKIISASNLIRYIELVLTRVKIHLFTLSKRTASSFLRSIFSNFFALVNKDIAVRALHSLFCPAGRVENFSVDQKVGHAFASHICHGAVGHKQLRTFFSILWILAAIQLLLTFSIINSCDSFLTKTTSSYCCHTFHFS